MVSVPLYEETRDEPSKKANEKKQEKEFKPMFYVHHGAFMKVLGCTVDVDIQDSGDFLPVLYDAHGDKLEP